MSEELKDFQTAPTLTLNPFAEEEKAQPEVKKEEPLMDENVLSEEERKMADQFANQIDLTNSAMILQYGAGTQSKMADFSETALENVKTKDLGEVGELLGNVVKELKNFDEEEEKGFFGIFKKQANKIQALKTKYAKAETNINQICQALEGHQVQLMKDVAILDKMYELNLTYFKELAMYILAGKKKLEEQQDITVRFYEHVIDRFGREKARELDRLMLELESVLRDELNLMNNQEKGGEANE